MDNGTDLVKCPYCGATNTLESEFCGTCYKKLMVPPEVRAEAMAARLMAQAVREGPFSDHAGRGAAPPQAAQSAAVRRWGRAGLAAGLFLYYTRWLAEPEHFSYLDFVNLGFHEAGHIFLGFFGRFIMFCGGTIFQLLFPALCLAHLRRRGANLGWQLCLFWLGENLLNISVYAGDAISQTLPLVGGGEHDWTYLLTETGLIAHTAGVSRLIFLCGSAVIFWSLYLIGSDALKGEPVELGSFGRIF
jgi:hypothetical protein